MPRWATRLTERASPSSLELCHRSIGPAISEADVREMLLQHILTQDLFLRVFAEDQFHRENNVARQLAALERTFFTGGCAPAGHRPAARILRSHRSRGGRHRRILGEATVPEGGLRRLLQSLQPRCGRPPGRGLHTQRGGGLSSSAAQTTCCRGTLAAAWRTRTCKSLTPATGTGTFVTSLIDYLPADRLEYKYLNEMHANEVAILPYYIANLNIEYSYKERTGKYLEFPNLCFVDTLDNMDWQQAGATGGAVTRQGALFNLGGMSEENWIRVQELERENDQRDSREPAV